jgi:hypothetical protein
LASHTQDDAFREIQLNGKQLVFLFMAATVVSVVIFLCGVLVGRGVRAERSTMADAGGSTIAETMPQQEAPPPSPTPAGSDPTAAAPPPAVDDLTYFNRLDRMKAPAEELNAVAEQATPPPVAKAPEPARSAAPTPAPAAAPKAPAPAVGQFGTRREAESIATRLQKEEQFKPWITR